MTDKGVNDCSCFTSHNITYINTIKEGHETTRDNK